MLWREPFFPLWRSERGHDLVDRRWWSKRKELLLDELCCIYCWLVNEISGCCRVEWCPVVNYWRPSTTDMTVVLKYCRAPNTPTYSAAACCPGLLISMIATILCHARFGTFCIWWPFSVPDLAPFRVISPFRRLYHRCDAYLCSGWLGSYLGCSGIPSMARGPAIGGYRLDLFSFSVICLALRWCSR